MKRENPEERSVSPDASGERTRLPRVLRAPESVEQGTQPQVLRDGLGNRALESLLRSGASAEVTEHVVRAIADEGSALGASRRAELEAQLGGNLSSVRVHDGASASASARALNAVAYTLGEDIVVDPAQIAPGSPEFERLLSHEAAHVLQQRKHGDAVQTLALQSQPGDASEQEADQAALAVARGEAFEPKLAPSAAISRQPAQPQVWPPVAWNSEWFPSQLSGPPKTPPSYPTVFDDPYSWTTAGAPTAFDKFAALSAPMQRKTFELSYPSGGLKKSLAALGERALDLKYQAATRQLLRWVEEYETHAASGKTDAELADTESKFLAKIPPAVIGSGGWGGTPGATRWAGLLKPAQAAWTKRAQVAIAQFVNWAAANSTAAGLKLTTAQFEWNPDSVDAISFGAYATVGSVRGKTVAIGFEFVAMTEVAPQYVLSTVVHELTGHVMFDDPKSGPSTYAGELYAQAAGKVPGAPPGTETYDYYQSEIYSLLREIPYFFKTGAGDASKVITLPDRKTTIGAINADPRDLILHHLKAMVSKWEPSVLAALLQGFFRRINIDPLISTVARSEFARLAKLIGITVV